MTRIEGMSPTKRALLEQALRERRRVVGTPTGIPRRSGTEPVPLSFAQQRMWFLQLWEPDAPTFNGARAIRLRGKLDRRALEQAFADVIERHETLRTVVAPTEPPLQVVLDSWSFELGVLRLEGPDSTRGQDLEDLLRELSRERFDLTADLMLRGSLVELGRDDHVLLVRMHHIAADAHSFRVLFTELSELYDAHRAGRRPNLPQLPIRYSDFAVWQRRRLSGRLLEDLVSYWGGQLEGAPQLLALPTDRARQPVQRHSGSHHRFAFPNELGERVVAIARTQRATFFITMLAVFATLLYRLSGEDDIVVGSPIASRNHVEVESLIGFFTNTIALRVPLAGNPSFTEVIGRAKETALGAYAHQDMPFEKVVEALRPRRSPSHHPLFQVNFRAQAGNQATLELSGLHAEPVPVDIGFSRFDLALELELGLQGLVGYFEYDEDLFDRQSVEGFVGDLSALLEQVAADPDAPVLAIQLPGARERGRRSTRPGAIARRAPRRPAAR